MHTRSLYTNWLLVHSGGMLVAFGLGVRGPGLPLIVGFGLASLAAWVVMASARWRNGYWLGGPANILTALRLTGIGLIGLAPAEPWLVALAGLAVIGLDAVDGQLARMMNTQSRFGAWFDQETDAFFVLVLSWKLWETGAHGDWVLGMGLVRYVYALPDLLLPQPVRQPAVRPYARIIAGIVMVGLPLAFLFPGWITGPGVPGLGLLLAYSFGRSAYERFAP